MTIYLVRHAPAATIAAYPAAPMMVNNYAAGGVNYPPVMVVPANGMMAQPPGGVAMVQPYGATPVYATTAAPYDNNKTAVYPEAQPVPAYPTSNRDMF